MEAVRLTMDGETVAVAMIGLVGVNTALLVTNAVMLGEVRRKVRTLCGRVNNLETRGVTNG